MFSGLVQYKVKSSRFYHLSEEMSTFFKRFLGMMDGSPWVGHIKEQSISFYDNSIDRKAFRDDISPGGCNLLDLEILKKLLGDLCSLLIKLKGKKMPFFSNSLSNGTRQ